VKAVIKIFSFFKLAVVGSGNLLVAVMWSIVDHVSLILQTFLVMVFLSLICRFFPPDICGILNCIQVFSFVCCKYYVHNIFHIAYRMAMIY